MRARFCARLAETANVTASCEAGGFPRKTAYSMREYDPEFRAAWDNALEQAIDTLEAECRRRAVEGVEEPVFQGGVEVGRIRRYSDKLAQFLLQGHRKHVFAQRAEITGANGGPVEIQSTTVDAAKARLLKLISRTKAETDGVSG